VGEGHDGGGGAGGLGGFGGVSGGSGGGESAGGAVGGTVGGDVGGGGIGMPSPGGNLAFISSALMVASSQFETSLFLSIISMQAVPSSATNWIFVPVILAWGVAS